MASQMEIGKQFLQLRRRNGYSRAQAAKLIGCSPRTLASLEKGDTLHAIRDHTLAAAVRQIEQWTTRQPAYLAAERQQYSIYGPIPRPVDVSQLESPLDVLKAGLANTLALLEDPGISLRSRLVHTRKQLEFLLVNFLQDASLPPGPEVENSHDTD